jgi:enolase-phosphatase E1
VLLDIEGTTSSIAFVYDVMFQYVRRHLSRFLQEQAGDPRLLAAVRQMSQDAGIAIAQETLAAHVLDLMDRDQKTTGLKQLQGMIWRSGFESGELQAHVFDDVEPTLRRWKAAGLDLRIYSSGSVQAQKLFFGHTQNGNLLPLFTQHYDTQIGGKRESASYEAIVRTGPWAASEYVFVSDVLPELQAAHQAGMQAIASVRPGNAPLPDPIPFPKIRSFKELNIVH